MTNPYLNEPIAAVLEQELSAALLTAQAMAENAAALQEQILPTTAMHLHNQLVAIERCVVKAIGLIPVEP